MRHLLVSCLVGGLLLPAAVRAQQAVECDRCHGDPDFLSGRQPGDPEEDPLFVPDTLLAGSAHGSLSCTSCHVAGYKNGYPHALDEAQAADLGLISLATPTGPTWVRSCGSCHGGIEEEIRASSHAPLTGTDVAATCTICHSAHRVYGRLDRRSAMYPLNQVETCARCHSGESAAGVEEGEAPRDFVAEYESTVHARGLHVSGLVTSATCSDCHGAHRVLPSRDPASRVSRDSIPSTCGSCHEGVLEVYLAAKHGENIGLGTVLPRGGHRSRVAPNCSDCHSSHEIQRVDVAAWHLAIDDACGDCHEDLWDSYHLTYHGKVTELGYGLTAECTDCHTAHNVRPTSDPLSTVSSENVISTCRQCHPDANASFVQYYSHGDYRDRARFPVLWWTYWLMTGLLVSVFSLWALHTALWAIRATTGPSGASPPWRSIPAAPHGESGKGERGGKPGGSQRVEESRTRAGDPGKGEGTTLALDAASRGEGPFLVRFSPYHRIVHVVIIISFLGLITTGMPLKFSHTPWAHTVVSFLGGFQGAGLLHRIFAVLTFGYMIAHVVYLARTFARSKDRWRMFYGDASMVFGLQDVRDLVQQVKWFFRLGPPPRFGRFSYLDKFDYWGEAWGIFVIGGSGLILWFPEFFARYFPGWIFNVATIIHSIEALLAASIILVVHLFNVHVRQGKFPIDLVIFTGRATADYVREEHPIEYERYVREGRLAEMETNPPAEWLVFAASVFGFLALAVGLIWAVLLLWAVFI
jgi:cytochrome b subunit of formate dehydrogenase